MDLLKQFLVLLNILFAIAYPAIDVDLARSNIAMEPSRSAGTFLTEWTKNKTKGNPEEQGPYLEGDIIISEARNGVRLPALRWPKATIPYVLEGRFSNEMKNVLSNAIDEIKSKTCVKMIPRANEPNYVAFTSDDSGCWSSVGMVGGKQIINLQAPCLNKVGTAIHEICHAIGFYHEQNRSDRDGFVEIVNENIPKDKRINFDKLLASENDNLGQTYDYGSVMHYSQYSFSMNGQPTIKSKGSKETEKQMGQRDGLSKSDIKKINLMYNCGK